MLEGPNTPEARNMLIELILSIPARLSDLLVVLTSLMRPLVMALQEGQELVGLGLRTLEYWVDRYDCLSEKLLHVMQTNYLADARNLTISGDVHHCYATEFLLITQQWCCKCLAPCLHTSYCISNTSLVLKTVTLSLLQLEPRVPGASNARSDWGSDEHTLGTPQAPEQPIWTSGTESFGQDGWPQQAVSQVTC